jgi:hypothetical protein
MSTTHSQNCGAICKYKKKNKNKREMKQEEINYQWDYLNYLSKVKHNNMLACSITI